MIISSHHSQETKTSQVTVVSGILYRNGDRRKMPRFKSVSVISIMFLSLSLHSVRFIAAGFQHMSLKPYEFSRGSFSRSYICLRDSIEDEIEVDDISELGNCRHLILLADSREKVLNIKLYRFGGPNLEEHLRSNPDLLTRQDAIESLTPGVDENGTQRLLYGNGVTGESVQYYAVSCDSSLSSTAEQDHRNKDSSLTYNHAVLGSVEAAKFISKVDNVVEVSVELRNLSVHKNARRRGIGKALVEAVQKYFCDQVHIQEKQSNQSCTGSIHLLVESSNESATRLYKNAGFVLNNPKDKPLCKWTWVIE